MKTIAIFVPIKLHSQRLPNKMLLDLGNKKVCSYIFDTLQIVKQHYANRNDVTCNVYCFCSDDAITKHIPEDIIFLKRDSSLDSDSTLGKEVYDSFVKHCPADIYAVVHATSPFVKAESIIKGLDSVLTDEYDSSYACSKIQTFTMFQDKPLNWDPNHVQRTQTLEPLYYVTSAFWIFTSTLFQTKGKFFGDYPKAIVTDRIESVDIDELDDYLLAQAIIRT